jgi:hypothetical protein
MLHAAHAARMVFNESVEMVAWMAKHVDMQLLTCAAPQQQHL